MKEALSDLGQLEDYANSMITKLEALVQSMQELHKLLANVGEEAK